MLAAALSFLKAAQGIAFARRSLPPCAAHWFAPGGKMLYDDPTGRIESQAAALPLCRAAQTKFWRERPHLCC